MLTETASINPVNDNPETRQVSTEIKYKKRESINQEGQRAIELLVDLSAERNQELQPLRDTIENYDLAEEIRRQARSELGTRGQKYCNGIGGIRAEIRSTFFALPGDKVADACMSVTELLINAVLHGHDNTLKIAISENGIIKIESANLYEDAKKQIPKLANSNEIIRNSQKPKKEKAEEEMIEEKKRTKDAKEKEEKSKPDGRGLGMVIGLTDQIVYEIDTGHSTGAMELRYNLPKPTRDTLVFLDHGQEISKMSKYPNNEELEQAT